MSRRLVLAAPGRVELLAAASRRLTPGEIRLRAIASGISHGTEMHLYRGRAAMNDHAFDRELRMFVRNSSSRSNYPLPLGYETVAEVVEVADDISDFAVGDVVHAPVPHQEESVVQTRFGSR